MTRVIVLGPVPDSAGGIGILMGHLSRAGAEGLTVRFVDSGGTPGKPLARGDQHIMSQTTRRPRTTVERGEISTYDMGRALRRSWWLPLLLALLGCALGWLGGTAVGTSYTSTASGVVVSDGGTDATEALAGENLAKSRAVTFSSISENSSTASAVIDRLHLNSTPEALLQNVKTSVPTDTSEVRVTTTAATPEDARELADTWVDELSKQVGELESATQGRGVKVQMAKVGEASTPQNPSSVSPSVLIAVGALLGLLAGVLLAIAREHQLTRAAQPAAH